MTENGCNKNKSDEHKIFKILIFCFSIITLLIGGGIFYVIIFFKSEMLYWNLSIPIIIIIPNAFLFAYLSLRLIYIIPSKINEKDLLNKCIAAFQNYLSKIEPSMTGPPSTASPPKESTSAEPLKTGSPTENQKKNKPELDEIDKIKEGNAENRMRYQFNAQQIDTYKSQQWSMTYYSLLMFAGIVGITRIITDLKINHLLIGIILIILITFILAFINYMFWTYQKCLISNRKVTISLEEKFQSYKDIRKPPIPTRYFNFFFQWHILFTFILAVVLGYAFTIFYIIYELIPTR